jgi:hypothetical protein
MPLQKKFVRRSTFTVARFQRTIIARRARAIARDVI